MSKKRNFLAVIGLTALLLLLIWLVIGLDKIANRDPDDGVPDGPKEVISFTCDIKENYVTDIITSEFPGLSYVVNTGHDIFANSNNTCTVIFDDGTTDTKTLGEAQTAWSLTTNYDKNTNCRYRECYIKLNDDYVYTFRYTMLPEFSKIIITNKFNSKLRDELSYIDDIASVTLTIDGEDVIFGWSEPFIYFDIEVTDGDVRMEKLIDSGRQAIIITGKGSFNFVVSVAPNSINRSITIVLP